MSKASPRECLIAKVLKEFQVLEIELRELLAAYSIKTMADLVDIKGILRKRGIDGQKLVLPSMGKLAQIWRVSKKLKIRPKKGRGKDFVRIQKLINKTKELLPRQP
jgi:hypothetical protein